MWSVVISAELTGCTHVISFIDTDKSVTQFKHVITQGNDDAGQRSGCQRALGPILRPLSMLVLTIGRLPSLT